MSATARVISPPAINPENKRYFEAASAGVLLVGRCKACTAHHFYPRVICPHCSSDQIEWVASNGRAEVYSYSTLHKGVPHPYTIAYVTLDEGVTMMTNLVACEGVPPHIGMRVEVVFRPATDGQLLPLFRPADAARPG